MHCGDCGFENPPGMRFCGNCASPLPAACRQCGFENPAGFRFCGSCAAPLAAAPSSAAGPAQATPAAPAASRGGTPAHLVEKIRRGAAALEGERKQVTVLFADVKGSMELAERLDPEEWSAIMQRFFAILSEGVERFEGFVDKFTGDGIMALFGAPIAHEDHAQRACFAALHLRDALRRYADELRRTKGLSFSVRIGINSGEVVVGSVSAPASGGEGLQLDYTAQGHTVGLAQRMEQLSAADSTYLTEHTARLVAGYFELRDLGAFDLKGSSAPVTVFELIGLGEQRSRLDRSRARGFSRFVGRHDELATLEAALQRAMDGQGGAVGVVADAGVGKSRLCTEFVERCRALGVPVYEAHCPSHGKSVPLLPVLELFRSYFGVTSRDDDLAAREKIAGRMLLLDRELEPFLPLAFEFLGVADPARPAPAMDPGPRQRHLFAFTRRLVEARSERHPAVLFLDDAHWIDEGSDAFVAQLAEVVPGTRTMLLLNFRPEYSAEWMSRTSYQQLPLHPLGGEAIDEFLSSLLGSDPSLAGLAQLVRERSGGNPFFMEEIVQALAESGSLAGEPGAYRLERPIDRLELPPTVHGILAARIDRLAEREKSVLQTAAVIGRRFPEPLLREVCGLPERDFEEALAALRRAEFLQEEALYPEAEYAFRHPLTHEVAERSQLAARRRRVHLAVARALEKRHADKPDEHAALIAHHWDEGDDAEPAARWHRRAAEWIAGSNVRQSRRHWERVRDLAERIEDEAFAAELGRQSRLMLFEYGWRLGMEADEAGRMLREGEAWAERREDPHALAELYNSFSMLCSFSLGDPRRAAAILEKGLQLAEQAGDGALACVIRLRQFFNFERIGPRSDVVAAMEAVSRHSAEDRERASALVGYHVPSAVVGFSGLPCMFSGQLDEALEHYRRGIEMARAHQAVEVEGWLLGFVATAWTEKGDAARAIAAARESVEFAERVESPLSELMSLNSLGAALLFAGEAGAAVSALSRALSLAGKIDLSRVAQIGSALARAHCADGDVETARTMSRRALEHAVERQQLGVELWAMHARAEVLVTAGKDDELDEAARFLDAAERRAGDIGHALLFPQLSELRYRLAARTGDADAAEAARRRARDLYLEYGAGLRAESLADDSGS